MSYVNFNPVLTNSTFFSKEFCEKYRLHSAIGSGHAGAVEVHGVNPGQVVAEGWDRFFLIRKGQSHDAVPHFNAHVPKIQSGVEHGIRTDYDDIVCLGTLPLLCPQSSP